MAAAVRVAVLTPPPPPTSRTSSRMPRYDSTTMTCRIRSACDGGGDGEAAAVAAAAAAVVATAVVANLSVEYTDLCANVENK